MKNKCISCHQEVAPQILEIGSFQVHVCSHCKHGLVHPVPDKNELEALYNSELYFAENMYDYSTISEDEINTKVKSYGGLFDKYLAKYLSSGKKILEIGAGGGFSLKYYLNKGYSVVGIEPSESSRKFAQHRLGITLHGANYEDEHFDGIYDVIILNHVLEHFIDIDIVLDKINANASQNGVLLIRVPNHDSYDRLIYGTKWPAYLPFHIHYFSKQSLINKLEQHGFEILLTDEFFSERFLDKIPFMLRKIILKLLSVAAPSAVNKFNGRTVTVLCRKK
jgi:2-polyprenyl-3-methyl-5-hydroxy-6-metoxy-1,4-benzoquinol methylase